MSVSSTLRTPAEIYDEFFVPALFAHWGPVVAEAAGVRPGDRVLDVACGTGALTAAVVDRVGPGGAVTGLDANPDMLRVARRKSIAVEWVEGVAEALPMPDGSYDAVVSQFGMMFFQDTARALGEMMRVLRAGRGLAVAVCDAVENSPGYDAFARLLDALFGRSVGDAFRAPFVLGNPDRLLEIARSAGISGAEVARHSGTVRFASIEAMVSTERACVWTLGGILDSDQFATLLHRAKDALGPFVDANDGVRFEMPALILTAQKRD